MTSEWMVTSNSIGGKVMYAAYRLKDVNAPDHAGNRVLGGGYTEDKQVAEILAEILNEKGANDEYRDN